MTLQIEIDLDNDAFARDLDGELAKMFKRIHRMLAYTGVPYAGTVADSNGNLAATFTTKEIPVG